MDHWNIQLFIELYDDNNNKHFKPSLKSHGQRVPLPCLFCCCPCSNMADQTNYLINMHFLRRRRFGRAG